MTARKHIDPDDEPTRKAMVDSQMILSLAAKKAGWKLVLTNRYPLQDNWQKDALVLRLRFDITGRCIAGYLSRFNTVVMSANNRASALKALEHK